MIRGPLTTAVLTGLYVTWVGSADPGDVVVGVALSAVLTATFWRYTFHGGARSVPRALRRVAAFPRMVVGTARVVLHGVVDVAVVVLGLRPPSPGIVAVPIEERTRRGVAVTAFAMTLSPGSLFLDADWDAGIMLFHVVDASDPDRVRREFGDFYRRYQRGVFP